MIRLQWRRQNTMHATIRLEMSTSTERLGHLRRAMAVDRLPCRVGDVGELIWRDSDHRTVLVMQMQTTVE